MKRHCRCIFQATEKKHKMPHQRLLPHGCSPSATCRDLSLPSTQNNLGVSKSRKSFKRNEHNPDAARQTGQQNYEEMQMKIEPKTSAKVHP